MKFFGSVFGARRMRFPTLVLVLQAACLSCLILAAGLGRAEDTDIYFTESAVQVSGDDVLANVLFILDISTSMAGSGGLVRVPGTNREVPASRFDALKAVMDDLLQDLQNVRIGIATFRASVGGNIRFPVAVDIDGDPSSIPAERGVGDVQASLNSGANDVVQVGTQVFDARASAPIGDYVTERPVTRTAIPGQAVYSTQTITTSADGERIVSLGQNRSIGYRFLSIPVPQGATVSRATLTLYHNRVIIEDDGNVTIARLPATALFTGSGVLQDATALSRTALGTTTVSATSRGRSVGDPSPFDVTSLVQDAVSDAAWAPGDAIFLRMTSPLRFAVLLFFSETTANVAYHPRLEIVWTATPLPPDPQRHSLGLHFPELNVPQGATITEASLSVVASNAGSGTARWSIAAEAADDATPFDSSVSNDVLRRTRGSEETVWQLPPMQADQRYSSCRSSTACTGDTLADVLQAIVNRTDWCGGNAINLVVRPSGGAAGSRFIFAQDERAEVAPRLEVSHSGGGTCQQRSASVTPLSLGDVGQVGRSPPTGSGFTTDAFLRLATDTRGPDNTDVLAAMVRFPSVNIPQGSTITEATLAVQPVVASRSADRSFTVAALAADDVSPLVTGSTVPFDTTKTTDTATLTVPMSGREQAVSGDLTAVIQAVVSRSGWASGNALGLYITNTGSADQDQFHGFGSSPGSAPRLRIEYNDATTADFKVRDRLRGLVAGLELSGNTPVGTTMLEAARYWRGATVYFGKARSTPVESTADFNASINRLSHPGSYCVYDSSDNLSCPGTTIDATTDSFGVVYPSQCTADDLSAAACINQEIQGTPRYQSPFRLPIVSCGGHHQVLLSDGLPNVLRGANQGIIDSLAAEVGVDDCSFFGEWKPDTDEEFSRGAYCSGDVAAALRNQDQDSTMAGRQTVTTHTIAMYLPRFSPGAMYLQQLAQRGGGTSFQAQNANELEEALARVFENILSGASSSVAAPSISSNSFNRLRSRDSIYFGLFDPSRLVSWDGNVRKYNICIDSDCVDADAGIAIGDLYDAAGKAVTDADSGAFLSDSTSLWASAADGGAVTEGGAGGKDDYTDATIYTDLGPSQQFPASGAALSTSGYNLNLTNWSGMAVAHVRNAVCGTSTETTADSDCGQLIRWWLGEDVEGSGDRWAFHDVLHSSPVLITYGGDRTAGTFNDRLIVGTNDGSLRFIHAETGATQWRFYPRESLGSLQILQSNPAQSHHYGVDLSPTVHVEDRDEDGMIEAGDTVRAFLGLRRGGSILHALDLSPDSPPLSDTAAVVPKFLWRLSSSDTGFSRLGQTWSQPAVARIATDGGPQDVLIFGGGYDERLDDMFSLSGSSHALGNAIYIVDSATGARVLSVTGNCSSCDGHIKVPNMRYSIASRVSLLDSDGDGLDDRIYVGDTGGQVWRIDLGSEIGKPGDIPGGTVVGRLASISVAADTDKQRRFFEQASVVQVQDGLYSDAAGGEYDYVFLGSGDRPNPLEDAVQDRFYAFRDRVIGKMPDQDSNYLADSTGYSTIGETDMVDVSGLSTLDSGNSAHRSADGWYFTLPGSGEKVYSSPTTIAGAVLFTSYLPVQATTGCGGNIGGGNAYNFDVLTSAATVDWDEDGTLEPRDDRVKKLGAGIPSSVLPLFTEEGVVGIVGIEGGAVSVGALSGLQRARTYWYEDES